MNPIKVWFTQHHIRASVVRPRQRPEESCPSQGSCSSCRKCRGLVLGSAYILSKPHGLSCEYSQQHLQESNIFRTICVQGMMWTRQNPLVNPLRLILLSSVWLLTDGPFPLWPGIRSNSGTELPSLTLASGVLDPLHLQLWATGLQHCFDISMTPFELSTTPTPPLAQVELHFWFSKACHLILGILRGMRVPGWHLWAPRHLLIPLSRQTPKIKVLPWSQEDRYGSRSSSCSKWTGRERGQGIQGAWH